jgi:hypothetical protein
MARPPGKRANAGSCKKPLRLEIETTTPITRSRAALQALYHPRGCLGASQSHLDIPPGPAPLEPLVLLARKHGIRLNCRSGNGAVTLEDAMIGLRVQLRAQGAKLACRNPLYAMITRSGMLYLAPIVLYAERSR